MNKPAPLDLAVVTDIVCPWCHIGVHQLRQALAQWQAQHPQAPAPRLRWLPFQLNPDMPAAGMPRADYLRAKFGPDGAGQMHQRLAAAAQAQGVALALDKVSRQPNTLRAHALVNLAAEAGAADAVMQALSDAFFLHGRDIGDPATLQAIGQACGLNEEIMAGALHESQVHERIAQADADLRAQGVQGVPLFVVAGAAGEQAVVNGAQGVQALVDALNQCTPGV
jgi:predicted DsbA family dithiol-disulfide isomerase